MGQVWEVLTAVVVGAHRHHVSLAAENVNIGVIVRGGHLGSAGGRPGVPTDCGGGLMLAFGLKLQLDVA
jgi:hypothetical protein